MFKVRPPTADEVALMHAGQTLIGFVWPAQNPDLMQQLAAKKVTVNDDEPPLTPEQEALFEHLRAWRKQEADERAVPAYVILDNMTLAAIARARPSSLDALAELRGIGAAKLESYGEQVLEVVAAN